MDMEPNDGHSDFRFCSVLLAAGVHTDVQDSITIMNSPFIALHLIRQISLHLMRQFVLTS